MSLTGHLDVFPLEEILRLLARAHKSGCLRVDSSELHGRVYLTNGSLALATVATDEELRRQLAISKVVGEDALRSAEIGGKNLEDLYSDGPVNDFFREEVVENLYRIRKAGQGQFVFNVDVVPRYRVETSFDVELCVSEADRRAAEWADIESVIPTIDVSLRISPEAPNGEPVTLAPGTWRMVAGFEGPGSVRSLAERLGMSRFRVAKDLTALVRSGLVEAETPIPSAPVDVEESLRALPGPEPGWLAPQSDYAASTHVASPPVEVGYPPSELQPASEPVTDSYNQGWWTEPLESAEVEEPKTDLPVEPSQPSETSDPFLDRVFSQLEDTPHGEGSVHAPGFLKRRRMSSAGIDE